ncbi:SMI1/KNR4 family protein [Singulisphaera sp. Ch08]|uniref:SMI1/KNR4 family protein n=1 Tax=Singulisphaera sp. Ch08 TaxID=3120278 RepID=A0AAU7CRN4_9BACT
MVSPLNDLIGRWVASVGIDPKLVPASIKLETHFDHAPAPSRPGADPQQIKAWEQRHGYLLPDGLRAWLLLSNGFYLDGPLIHPLSAIGPMVPFARVPDLVVQPESWFELGNPNVETVCIDLAYRWPGGDFPIFTSGDDQTHSRPRMIASGFNSWFLEVLKQGGREFWFDPGFSSLGDPWVEHRRHTPAPPLPDRLRPLAARVLPLMRPGADDRSIANSLGISRGDVEVLFRHLQHGSANFAGP